jgi:hypothetical protein
MQQHQQKQQQQQQQHHQNQQQQQYAMRQFQHIQQQTRGGRTQQRRVQSFADFNTSPGIAISSGGGLNAAARRHSAQLPASMPEQPLLGSAVADDRSWGASGHGTALQAGSAPVRGGLLAAPPSFSPFELKNMVDESSLELFESQAHLLDTQSRLALQKQRQYLQWQSSVEEPGPLQSTLERSDSAGSGSNMPQADDSTHGGVWPGGATAEHAGELEQLLAAQAEQLRATAAERDALRHRISSLESQLEMQLATSRCRMCGQVGRSALLFLSFSMTPPPWSFA